MNIITDERGQGAAEYILLFGGVIVVAIAALLLYQAYFESGAGIGSEADLHAVRESVNKT
ncbi:MAG TPA: class III signal peptide-containing protein [Methanothermobacter sp.]|nr:class III signal peptide-containing protein [Methanothermobacter sp.]